MIEEDSIVYVVDDDPSVRLAMERLLRSAGYGAKTFKVHRARVMEKMSAQSLADLVRFAEKLGVRGSPD